MAAAACLGLVVLLCGRAMAPSRAATPAATQPTTRSAADSARIAPLATARKGDHVAYRTLGGRQWHRVLNTTQLLAEIEVRSEQSGRMIGLPGVRTLRQESDYALDLAESEGAEIEFEHETIDAAGRAWDCRLTVARWKSGDSACERRVWMNPEIPLYGLARMELRVNGRLAARMELTDFGRDPATTRADK